MFARYNIPQIIIIIPINILIILQNKRVSQNISILWNDIFERKQEIFFAYQTFNWSNRAKGGAGVSVTIVGLRNNSSEKKLLFFVHNYFQNKIGWEKVDIKDSPDFIISLDFSIGEVKRTGSQRVKTGKTVATNWDGTAQTDYYGNTKYKNTYDIIIININSRYPNNFPCFATRVFLFDSLSNFISRKLLIISNPTLRQPHIIPISKAL